MKPWEFYRLTCHEYEAMLDGWSSRYQRQRRERAWVVANLMNVTGNCKEPITVDGLLGNGPDGKPVDMEKIRERAEQRRRERLAARGVS